MQLIATKTLPPLPVFLTTLIAKSHGEGRRQIRMELGLRYCPSMDLVATYCIIVRDQDAGEDDGIGAENEDDPYGENEDETMSVCVWRLNGQKVFEISVEADDGSRVEVTDVQWKDDGQILAVLSSDNFIRLINSFSGKTVHRFSSVSAPTLSQSTRTLMSTQYTKQSAVKAESTDVKIRSKVLSYSTHFANPISKHLQLQSVKGQSDVVLDDLLSLNADIGRLLQTKPNLPEELASIDVESFLPKLACLPPAGFGIDDVFSTRASIDAIFHASKRNLKSGTVDILATGTDNGIVNLRFFDSFEIGDKDLAAANGLPRGSICGPVRYLASQPFSGNFFVICDIAQPGKSAHLHLLSLDLKVITQSSTTLPILATKATQLHNLLRYLTQIQSQLVREVKAAFDLPSRFLSNLNEDLEKQDGEGSNFVNTAYHNIVTGEVTQALKEWLVDQLGERGVKRWEKAVGDCLELVRRLVSESWNPAVERLGVVASRLAGISRWNIQRKGGSQSFDIDKRVIESLKETVNVMTICGEELLRDVNTELAGFASFVKWLKWEVEAASLEDTSERLDEMRENSDHADILNILEYIKSGPANTVVRKYIGPAPDQNDMSKMEDVDFYAQFKEDRRKSGKGRHWPTFDILLARLKRQSENLFEQVAQGLRDGIMAQYITQLPSKMDPLVMDIKIVPEPGHGRPKVCMVSRSKDTKETVLYTVIDPVPGYQRQSKGMFFAPKLLEVPDALDILDVKFVDDISFMVLASTADDAQLHMHALPSQDQDSEGFELCHTFDDGLMESGMKPRRLDINGRRGRRALAVTDAEGRGFCVFDLDSGDGSETDGADDDDIMHE